MIRLARSKLKLTVKLRDILTPTVHNVALRKRRSYKIAVSFPKGIYKHMPYPPPAQKVNKENPQSASRRPFPLKPGGKTVRLRDRAGERTEVKKKPLVLVCRFSAVKVKFDQLLKCYAINLG